MNEYETKHVEVVERIADNTEAISDVATYVDAVDTQINTLGATISDGVEEVVSSLEGIHSELMLVSTALQDIVAFLRRLPIPDLSSLGGDS